MAKFLNNEPAFKVGDKVVYSRRRDDMAGWETESIGKGPLTISQVDKSYTNDELTDVNYWVEGLDYVYSEDWLSYALAGPKFKIGDKVRLYISGRREGLHRVEDVLTIRYQKDGHEEYLCKLADWPLSIPESDLKLEVVSEEEQLVRDLEICGGVEGCNGCSYKNPDGTKMPSCYNQLNLDAAELIKKLQKRVKELEEKK